jgi:oxalate decarboxylase/phosphoglucose isomerase-like protein (cupin superfamily)
MKTDNIYSGDLGGEATKNRNLLKVIYTVPGYTQTAVMHIPADSNTGFSVSKATQTIMVEGGSGSIFVDYGGEKGMQTYPLRPAKNVIVPAGLRYSIINTSTRPLKLVNVLSPSLYPADKVVKKAAMPNKRRY